MPIVHLRVCVLFHLFFLLILGTAHRNTQFTYVQTYVNCTHIIGFEVHLIKFYMIISSHFDDHQLRLGVLVTLGLVCNSFEYSSWFVAGVVAGCSFRCCAYCVVLIAFLHLSDSIRYILHSFMNLEHFPRCSRPFKLNASSWCSLQVGQFVAYTQLYDEHKQWLHGIYIVSNTKYAYDFNIESNQTLFKCPHACGRPIMIFTLRWLITIQTIYQFNKLIRMIYCNHKYKTNSKTHTFRHNFEKAMTASRLLLVYIINSTINSTSYSSPCVAAIFVVVNVPLKHTGIDHLMDILCACVFYSFYFPPFIQTESNLMPLWCYQIIKIISTGVNLYQSRF